MCFFFQAEDGIRDLVRSRGLGDVYKRQAENNQLIPHPEPLELADEVAELLEFYGVLAEEKEIRLSVVGHGTVSGDRLMLRRAISNLLSLSLIHISEPTRPY